MEDNSEALLKKFCCTCLCDDRKLFQLCRVNDGINNLYWLLSYDSEAFREGFHRDCVSLYICWECKAVMSRICDFRYQVCTAQKQLTLLAEGQYDKAIKMLSKLSHTLRKTYDFTFMYEGSDILDNFVDCGPIEDVKVETNSDIDDIPLSQIDNNYISKDRVDIAKPTLNRCKENSNSNKRVKKKRIKDLIENEPLRHENKKYYSTIKMNEEEMTESRNMKKLSASYIDASFKCESCVLGFKDQIDLDRHKIENHQITDKHIECDICKTYIEITSLEMHRKGHYERHKCDFCDFLTFDLAAILDHLKAEHVTKNLIRSGKKKRLNIKNPGSKPRRNKAMTDKRTPFGFLCSECNKYFDTKKLRWVHIQRSHRDGFECSTCGKRFPFRNNLTRHQLTHTSPQPRVECSVCHKRVRTDLLRAHSRTHSPRETYACALCVKTFASRASYEHHLKYTRAHAVIDILKYKCSECEKGYKSKGELRDHINYQHMGKTQHKCPVCGKALATRRCVTRHVRRAHDGVKENERDKICQQCGKAFRDKKGLREHELIHTGERPLSCEICGCTFRQNASLYTHRKRVHKIYNKRRSVELMESEIPNT